MLPKVPIVLKNASNKNRIKSNFSQETYGRIICLSPPVVKVGGSKGLPFFEYNVLGREWQILRPPAPLLAEVDIRAQ